MTEPISALNLAPIHATALSIFIGFLSLYTIDLLRKLENLSGEIKNEAEKVNNLQVYSYNHDISPELAMGDSDLLSRFAKLATGGSLGEESIDEAQRGKELLKTLTLITNQYPFPGHVTTDNEGNVQVKKKELDFTRVDEVKKWTENADESIWRLTIHIDTNAKKISEYVNKYESSESGHQDILKWIDEDDNGSTRDDTMRLLNKFSPTSFAKNMIKKIKEIKSIHKDVEVKINRYENMRPNLVTRIVLFALSILAVCSFLFSVILPTFGVSTSPILWKWLPAAFYLSGFVVVFYSIFNL